MEVLKAKLLAMFEQWKAVHGQKPQADGTLLTGFHDLPFDDAPPYKCAGNKVHGYTELLWHIIGDNTPSWQLLALSLATYDMDCECMSNAYPSIEREYLNTTRRKIMEMKSLLDKPDVDMGRKRNAELANSLKIMKDQRPPVTEAEADQMLEACLSYGLYQRNAKLGDIRKHVARNHKGPNKADGGYHRRSWKTVEAHTPTLKDKLKILRGNMA